MFKNRLIQLISLRLLFFISIIFGVAAVSAYNSYTNPVYITGHLRKNPTDHRGYINGVTVFVKGDDKLLAKTVTDRKGDFKFFFTPGKEKAFNFYCTGRGMDTILLASVTEFDNDTPDMTFYIPAKNQ